jgi:hypothetical protein
MSERTSSEPDEGGIFGPTGVPVGGRWFMRWLYRHRVKVADRLERDREGDYWVPTWVLVLGLIAVIASWVAIIVL